MQPRRRLRGAEWAVFLAAVLALPASAQIHKVAPPEKVTRAIGVYEWTGELAKPTAARIVPISLFINGHLEDAGLYLSEPMPLALQTGVVYGLQQAGKNEGTVTLDYARNVLPPGATTDVAAIGAWYGYGKYAAEAKTKPSTLKASARIAPIDGALPDDADDKPHFAGKQPGQGNGADAGATTTTSGSPNAPDDPDRPHMTRSGDATPPATTDTTTPADDPDRPTLRHRDLPPDAPQGKKQKHGDSSVIPMDTSLNDDPNRPTMQRGKPAGLSASPELHTLPADLHQRVAVSDAANRDPHIFSRPWETHTEHAEVLAELQALAEPLLVKYETTYKLAAPTLAAPPVTKSTHAKATRSTHVKAAPVKTALPALLEETLTPFELTYGGLPTFVYQAQSPVAIGGPVFVTVVAQRLPSGEYQVALSNLTDASHLDRTPHFRFIDAVDPEASHRASLLFELRSQSSRQFALYQVITAHADQQFVTAPIQ
jgi:hypothetical protein